MNGDSSARTSNPKIYAVGERECWKLGDHYTRHSLAMTAEGLHKKSDIAAELAHRDQEIERLTRENATLRGVCNLWGLHADPEHPDNVAKRSAHETTASPQAPIVKVIIENGKAAYTTIYAPGLPDGTHDLYCVPETVAPMMRERRAYYETHDPPHCPTCDCGASPSKAKGEQP